MVPQESTAQDFHLNGNTTGFHPQTLKWHAHPLCSAKSINIITGINPQKLSFEWSYFRMSFTDWKVITTLYSITNNTTGITALKLLSEWSHFRISYTDLQAKVRMTLYCTIQFNSNSITGRYCTIKSTCTVQFNSIQ